MEFDKRIGPKGENPGKKCFPNLGSLVEVIDNFRDNQQMTPDETREVILRASGLMDPDDLSPLVFRFLLGLALYDVRHGFGVNRSDANDRSNAGENGAVPIFTGPDDPVFKALVKKLSPEDQ